MNKASTPQVMGILNITPDSFFAGSRKQTEREIADRVVQILDEGAAMIDIGGYSSRPNAAFVSSEEEEQRLFFGLEILFREAPKEVVVSIDTFRASVARACVERFGPMIINDISGGGLDDAMFDTVAALGVPYILMHMRGTPQTMMQDTHYDDLMGDLLTYFEKKIVLLQERGVRDVIIDPGWGFSKTTAQNYEVLREMRQFKRFGLPVLAGLSRKTMIRDIIGVTPAEALNGTTALNMFALTQGADILRVHDVKAAVETVKLYKAINYVA